MKLTEDISHRVVQAIWTPVWTSYSIIELPNRRLLLDELGDIIGRDYDTAVRSGLSSEVIEMIDKKSS